MTYLEKFTPAEAYLILNQNQQLQKQVLKITFKELILKEVLKLETVVKTSKNGKRKTTYKYVKTGSVFNSYKHLTNEAPLLEPFRAKSKVRLLLKNYVRLIYDASGGFNSYIWNGMIKQPKLRPFFRANIFYWIIGKTKLTKLGESTKMNLMNELADIEEKLTFLIDQDQKRAAQLVKDIGAHLFLINIDFKKFKHLDQYLFTNLKDQDFSSPNISKSSYLGYFDADDNYFDSTFDSVSSEFGESGCSSCSGCSGCGGCGGCS